MFNRIFFVIIGISIMVYIYKKVSKNKLMEKESIFWMIGAIGMLMLSIFPNSIIILSNIVGIEYAPSLLFLIGILFSFLLIFRLTIYITEIKAQNKELAQVIAILEKRVKEMENHLTDTANK